MSKAKLYSMLPWANWVCFNYVVAYLTMQVINLPLRWEPLAEQTIRVNHSVTMNSNFRQI